MSLTQHGQLDVLRTNAGINHGAAVAECEVADDARVVAGVPAVERESDGSL